MNRMKKIGALSLIAVLLLSLMTPVLAAAASSEKEEVVYVTSDASGLVKDVHVVNIFGGGDITDYGDYTAVRMMTTGDQITQQGDMITFTTEAEKVYYQGTLENAELPWNISIRYFLDGQEYSPEEIQGQSGALEIRFAVTKNKNCSGNFFETIALQAVFTLDTAVCKNIAASDATFANVGANKQLTYTILPGKGIDTTITANVTDFYMDAVNVNGVKLNLNINIEDEELKSKVNELIDATRRLNDGASSIHGGASDLKDGAGTLTTGIDSLSSGVYQLDNGIVALQNGLATMQNGINTLNSQSGNLTSGSSQVMSALQQIQAGVNSVNIDTTRIQELTSASSQVKAGFNSLYDGAMKLAQAADYNAFYNTFMANGGSQITYLKDQNVYARTQLQSLIPMVQSLDANIAAQLNDLVTLLGANNDAMDGILSGTRQYFNELSNGSIQLLSGIEEFRYQYEQFDAGINELVTALSGMTGPMSQLVNGINQLVSEYQNLDSGITSYTQGVASIAAGYQTFVDGYNRVAAGSKELLGGASQLSTGAKELYNGVSDLSDGANEMSDGANELYGSTSKIEEEVQSQIDAILSDIGGEDSETISFVSEKNTNIKSLQFVIKTEPIEKKTVAEDKTDTEKPLNFWQKLLKLFGLYKS